MVCRCPREVNSTRLLSECHGAIAFTSVMALTGISRLRDHHNAFRLQSSIPLRTEISSTPKTFQIPISNTIAYHTTTTPKNGRR